jgi:hypothetical protein
MLALGGGAFGNKKTDGKKETAPAAPRRARAIVRAGRGNHRLVLGALGLGEEPSAPKHPPLHCPLFPRPRTNTHTHHTRVSLSYPTSETSGEHTHTQRLSATRARTATHAHQAFAQREGARGAAYRAKQATNKTFLCCCWLWGAFFLHVYFLGFLFPLETWRNARGLECTCFSDVSEKMPLEAPDGRSGQPGGDSPAMVLLKQRLSGLETEEGRLKVGPRATPRIMCVRSFPLCD